MIHAVIMAGGGGTRFWPRSRAKRPKQFLILSGDRSLLQQAQERLEVLIPPERTWIITSEQHKSQVRQQLPQIPGPQIIGEPVGRDTAPCVALGAALIHRQDPEAVIVVTPADHVIEPAAEFHRGMNVAIKQLDSHPDALLTFGIPPTFASTGYGYIHRDAELGSPQGVTVNRVKAFKEKPKPEVAEQYVASREYFWNSGIFLWKSATILRELQTQQPLIHDAVQKIAAAWGTADFSEVFWQQYNTIPKISIDFAVMEHSKNVLMVQAPFRWDDVGSWLALERMNPHDADGNTVLGNHLGIKTSGCILSGDAGVLIATIGVKDLLIIQDGDAILVADKKEEGTVRQIVEALKTKKLEKYL